MRSSSRRGHVCNRNPIKTHSLVELACSHGCDTVCGRPRTTELLKDAFVDFRTRPGPASKYLRLSSLTLPSLSPYLLTFSLSSGRVVNTALSSHIPLEYHRHVRGVRDGPESCLNPFSAAEYCQWQDQVKSPRYPCAHDAKPRCAPQARGHP